MNTTPNRQTFSRLFRGQFWEILEQQLASSHIMQNLSPIRLQRTEQTFYYTFYQHIH
jgi:hypothetical protein